MCVCVCVYISFYNISMANFIPYNPLVISCNHRNSNCMIPISGMHIINHECVNWALLIDVLTNDQ